MNPKQVPNDSDFYSSPIYTSRPSISHQQYNNASASMQPSYISQQTQYNPNLNKHSFFCNLPNNSQIYKINYKEIDISFELVSALLNGNNDQNHFNNLHEFYFLKFDEKKCYKVTCELISSSLVVQFLNRNIHNFEIKQDMQQDFVDFSIELKQNLEYYLNQFFTQNL
ncbi:hypothetical protein RclHR1_09010003 [Rhizophagus clarus]|uniref:Uncharacterized protein n=1 Tax=Rhizophagus clarus TaxID=94130 RepID=A0A2Z6SGM4_9GLOM|nr:hypothetical protein RclHR1_09010003 [Rhizophagus clarus]GES73939.1 hypothetical protein GLOIN_2v1762085 [Rhizophagus clarus]